MYLEDQISDGSTGRRCLCSADILPGSWEATLVIHWTGTGSKGEKKNESPSINE